jgi:hypothetical protein
MQAHNMEVTMAKAQHRRKNSKRRIVTMTGIMAGSAGAVALVTLGMSGVGSSAFNSTVTPAPVAVNAATVSLTTGATDTLSGATVANMIPGDYTEQVANLKNGGSANFGSVTIGTEVCDTSSTCTPSSTTTGNNLITGTNGLTLEAQTCSVAWTASGTTAPITYTCSGTKTTALAATPINTLDGTPSTLTFPSTSVLTAKTGESYMMFTVALGSSASNTDQGLTDNVSFGFTATTAAPGAIS